MDRLSSTTMVHSLTHTRQILRCTITGKTNRYYSLGVPEDVAENRYSFICLQVLRVHIYQGHIMSIQEVYADDGHRIQGSSVAIRYKDTLLIGTITHKAALCHLTTLDV